MSNPAQLPPVTIGDTEDTAPDEWNLSDLLQGQTLCLDCGAPFKATVDNFTLCAVHEAERARR